MNRGRWLATLLTVILAAGCAAAGSTGSPSAAPDDAAPAPTSKTQEESVRPGVNDRYYDDELGVWVDRLERPKREVVAHRDEIVEKLPIALGMRVADVGAGTGLFTESLAQRVGADGLVVAVDIVPSFLERLREIAAANPNVRVHVGELRSPNLEAESFDLVFMCAVYHHLEYPQTYLSNLRANIAPGGKLVLIDFERIEGTTSPRMLKHVRAGRDTVVDELRDAGFEVTAEIELMQENYFLILEPR